MGSSCRIEPLVALKSILLIATSLLQRGSADYVETAPRPGFPPPRAVIPGECPLVFLQRDIQQAQQSCASSIFGGIGADGSRCCSQLSGLLFQTRVRYANETGRLLLPQASAEACIQILAGSLASLGAASPEACGITSDSLSESKGKACGDELTTVYDFWSAANHTYPGLTAGACFKAADCATCIAEVSDKILSLGTNRYPRLPEPECQDLAEVAMVAATWPVLAANGISQCLHQVDISPVVLSPKCTAWDWSAWNFTSIELSCGPQQIRPDRCCELMLALFAQVHALYVHSSGHALPQEEAEVCLSDFKAQLVRHNVPSTTVDTCKLNTFAFLFPVGCYNQTTINQFVPTTYFDQYETVCSGNSNEECGNCRPVAFALGMQLTNSSDLDYVNRCANMAFHQYLASMGDVERVTRRLNCAFVFPSPLGVGLPPLRKRHGGLCKAAIVGILVGGAAMSMIVLLLVVVAFRRRQSNEKVKLESLPSSLRALKFFTYKAVRRATNNFDNDRLVGSGSSGRVFRGDFNRETLAVKVFESGIFTNEKKAFFNEIATMASLRHRNLVTLKGCCVSDKENILIFEYCEQGSLQDHLYAPEGGRVLDWPTRVKIAVGAARGLAYLHEDCKPRVIHRDVKPNNILLTSNFEAKIADFGLAKLSDNTHTTKDLVGTYNFMPPEYVASGHLSEKSDVYSFGVVLLTLVAGRKPMKQDATPEEAFLPTWAWALAEQDNLAALVDPTLAESEVQEHAESIACMTKVALLCVHTAPSIRPTMRSCVAMLENNLEVPILPSRPVTLYMVASNLTSSTSDNSEDQSALI